MYELMSSPRRELSDERGRRHGEVTEPSATTSIHLLIQVWSDWLTADLRSFSSACDCRCRSIMTLCYPRFKLRIMKQRPKLDSGGSGLSDRTWVLYARQSSKRDAPGKALIRYRPYACRLAAHRGHKSAWRRAAVHSEHPNSGAANLHRSNPLPKHRRPRWERAFE